MCLSKDGNFVLFFLKFGQLKNMALRRVVEFPFNYWIFVSYFIYSFSNCHILDRTNTSLEIGVKENQVPQIAVAQRLVSPKTDHLSPLRMCGDNIEIL